MVKAKKLKPHFRLSNLRPSLKHAHFSKINLAVFILIFAGIGGYILLKGHAAGFTANIFTVGLNAGVGTPTCTRSPTLIDYETAVSTGHVCKEGTGYFGSSAASSLDNACHAAQIANQAGGTLIGVEPGDYYKNPANSFVFAADPGEDCSGGLGADVNPNCDAQQELSSACAGTGTTANWATFQCAQGDSSLVTWNTGDPYNAWFAWGNVHSIFSGKCFHSKALGLGLGGSPGTPLQNIQLTNMNIEELDISSVHNVLIGGMTDFSTSVGEWLGCGKADPSTPAAMQCPSNWAQFYNEYGNLGTSYGSAAGVSPYCGPGNDSSLPGPYYPTTTSGKCGGSLAADYLVGIFLHGAFRNVAFKHMYLHDIVSLTDDTTSIHPHGMLESGQNTPGSPYSLIFPNTIFDGDRFERTGVNLMQNDDGNSVLVQNSVFGCGVNMPRDTGMTWDTCDKNHGLEFGGLGFGTPTNVLIRYNVFTSGSAVGGRIGGNIKMTSDPGNNPAYINVQMIGNIFYQQPLDVYGDSSSSVCNRAGSTALQYHYNVYVNTAPCETDGTAVQLNSDPLINSLQTTQNHLWSDVPVINAHPASGVVLPKVPDMGPSYQVPTDMDGNVRSYPTSVGVYAGSFAPKPGDVNGDGRVDLADLAVLLTHYGQLANASQGDLNGDGKVTLADLAILLTNYGR